MLINKALRKAQYAVLVMLNSFQHLALSAVRP
jgi:hypothetical protein